MKFQFEKEAMRGDPMPDGLSLIDQMAYQTLACIYLRYHLKGITRDQGSEEKNKLIVTYEKEAKKREQEINMAFHYASTYASIERSANAYAKNRTLDNADRLYKALYGFEPNKEEK